MKDKILMWLATGNIGASSKAMAFTAADLPNNGNSPHDPDDLNRCLLLLDAVPEIRNHMDKIAAINTRWAALVDRWNEVEQCFLDEAGLNWTKARSAPKTYELMKAIGG